MGIHEEYLNCLVDRFKNKVIKNVSEFLSENWAIALYHDWFSEFIQNLKGDVLSQDDIKILCTKIENMLAEGKEINKETIKSLNGEIDAKTITLIEDSTLNFIAANQNLLPMYYVPNTEFN